VNSFSAVLVFSIGEVKVRDLQDQHFYVSNAS
jgi:hypothetical protein